MFQVPQFKHRGWDIYWGTFKFFDFFHAPSSTYPHSFQRLIYIRHSESDGLAHFEVGDETGHSPVVELAAADFQMTGEFLFGH